METNQDYYRDKVKKRCTPQNIAAHEIGMSNIHLNYWLKRHKDLGSKSLAMVKSWLDE